MTRRFNNAWTAPAKYKGASRVRYPVRITAIKGNVSLHSGRTVI